MNNRIEWIDMAKGYGVILVILGHFGLEKLGYWIYSFHMPLFFFLAGYVFKEKLKIKDFVLKRIKKLIIPYIFLGLGVILFNLLIMLYANTFDLTEISRQLKSLLFQIRYSNLWFLTCLFSLNFIFFILLNLGLSYTIVSILVLIMTFGGVIYYKFNGNPIFWNIDVCFTASIFFLLGYLYRKDIDFFKNIKEKINRYFSIKLLFLMSIFFNWLMYLYSQEGLEMFDSRYGNPILIYFIAIIGILLILKLSKKKTINWIKFIGENTLIYFAWHQNIAMVLIKKFLEILNFPFERISINIGVLCLYYIINLILILLILTFFTKILLKTKLKFLIGK